MIKYTPFLLLLILISCTQQMKFDKEKWNEQIDPAFPSSYRHKMLNDLTQNYKLIGLSCSQLKERLGHADYKDNNSISYKIILDYGGDIDPVYTQDLVFTYSKASIITSYKIIEWKK